jgi:hypothetical protein
MSDINYDEEVHMIDKFFEKNISKDIEIPHELQDKVNERIYTIKIKHHYPLKIFLSFAAAVIVIMSTLVYVPSAKAFAENIPIIREVIRFFSDMGITNAQNHGYLPADAISIKKNGYNVSLYNISIDEDRLFINGKISGIKKSKYPQDIDVYLKDFNSRRPSFNGLLDNDMSYTFELQYYLVPGELEKMLSKNLQYIDLDILIFKTVNSTNAEKNSEQQLLQLSQYLRFHKSTDAVVSEIKDIKIPLNSEMIQKSKVYNLDTIVKLNKALYNVEELNLKTFTISPTRMHINYSDLSKKGYHLNGFVNPYLKDDSGNKYTQINGMDTSQEERQIIVVPSLYFDDSKKLYFCFDGIYVYDGVNKQQLNFDIKKEIPLNLK